MKWKSSIWILSTLLIIGFLIRVWNLAGNPPSLYGDELTLVYDSYSILKTGGFDSTGKFLPLTFTQGANRPGGYIYASLPFVALFGPSALGIRLVSVFSGVLLIYLMYLLGKELISKKVGLIGATLWTFSPWDISLSRGGFESHLALVVAVLGIFLVLTSSKRIYRLILGALCLGLTMLIYPTYRLVVPIFLILLFLFQSSNYALNYLKTKSQKIIAGSVIGLFIIITLSQTLFFKSEDRFFSLNLFSRKDIYELLVQKSNKEQNLDDAIPYVSRFAHSKIVGYFNVARDAYFSNFSLDFLFLNGDRNPRHNMGLSGGLFVVEMISILLGTMTLFYKNRRLLYFLIVWILLAAVPATILVETHNLRSFFMLPPLILISAVGCNYIFFREYRFKKQVKYLILMLFLFQFMLFSERIFFLSPKEFSQFWAYPAKSAVKFVAENSSKYDMIVVSDRIDNIVPALQTYLKIDPREGFTNSKSELIEGIEMKKYQNVLVKSLDFDQIQALRSTKKKILYLASIYEKIDQEKPFFTTVGLDGQAAFIAVPIN